MISSTSKKLASSFEYSCLMMQITGELANKIKSLASRISDDDLSSDGREKDPHITALYGIHATNPDVLKALLSGYGKVKAKTGKVSVFYLDDYDVLKIEVDSKDLHDLNAYLRDNLAYTNKYDKYEPHITLAYVKKGQAKKYLSELSLEKTEIEFNSATFSDKNDKKTTVHISSGTKKASDEGDAHYNYVRQHMTPDQIKQLSSLEKQGPALTDQFSNADNAVSKNMNTDLKRVGKATLLGAAIPAAVTLPIRKLRHLALPLAIGSASFSALGSAIRDERERATVHPELVMDRNEKYEKLMGNWNKQLDIWEKAYKDNPYPGTSN